MRLLVFALLAASQAAGAPDPPPEAQALRRPARGSAELYWSPMVPHKAYYPKYPKKKHLVEIVPLEKKSHKKGKGKKLAYILPNPIKTNARDLVYGSSAEHFASPYERSNSYSESSEYEEFPNIFKPKSPQTIRHKINNLVQYFKNKRKSIKPYKILKELINNHNLGDPYIAGNKENIKLLSSLKAPVLYDNSDIDEQKHNKIKKFNDIAANNFNEILQHPPIAESRHAFPEVNLKQDSHKGTENDYIAHFLPISSISQETVYNPESIYDSNAKIKYNINNMKETSSYSSSGEEDKPEVGDSQATYPILSPQFISNINADQSASSSGTKSSDVSSDSYMSYDPNSDESSSEGTDSQSENGRSSNIESSESVEVKPQIFHFNSDDEDNHSNVFSPAAQITSGPEIDVIGDGLNYFYDESHKNNPSTPLLEELTHLIDPQEKFALKPAEQFESEHNMQHHGLHMKHETSEEQSEYTHSGHHHEHLHIPDAQHKYHFNILDSNEDRLVKLPTTEQKIKNMINDESNALINSQLEDLHKAPNSQKFKIPHQHHFNVEDFNDRSHEFMESEDDDKESHDTIDILSLLNQKKLDPEGASHKHETDDLIACGHKTYKLTFRFNR